VIRGVCRRSLRSACAHVKYRCRCRDSSTLEGLDLQAKEMASLTWAMVTDAQGQVAEVLHVPNRASKGKTGGRTIPLHPDLQAALVTLQTARGDMATPTGPSSSRNGVGRCHQRPCACGSIGAIPRSRWMAARRIPGAAPSLRGPRVKCRRSGAVSRTCRNSPALPAWHDPTLHRGRYGGQAHARRAAVTRAHPATAACTQLGRDAPSATALCDGGCLAHRTRRLGVLPAGTTGLATVFPWSPTLLTRPCFVHG